MKTVALVGNPNCGKTSLFNALTGEEQKVGNWPGVTVEQKTGTVKDKELFLVDLPGVYSLSPYSPEEQITRDYLLHTPPDVILNLIDGTNLQRNLYLTLQLLTLEIPMVAAVTFMDGVRNSGGILKHENLSSLLGIPVIPVSAKTREGLIELCDELNRAKQTPQPKRLAEPLEEHIRRLEKNPQCPSPKRFFAEKLLEGDAFEGISFDKERQKTESACNTDLAAAIASARYDRAEAICKESLSFSKNRKSSVGERIDKLLLHQFLGIPIFMAVLLGMFALVFGPPGRFLTGLIDYGISDTLTPLVSTLLVKLHASVWVSKLVLQAVLGGVGSVIKFVPQIGLLFLCLSFLEDSGYLARGAFLMDGFLRKIGLSGKAFLPLMMGFGCTASAVMATRAQKDSAQRTRTVFLLPLLSCGAKAAVYGMMVQAFWGKFGGVIVFLLYFGGIFLATIFGILDQKLHPKERGSSFVMELPPYRLPGIESLLKSAWKPCKDFLIRAGTLIFVLNIVLWVFQSITPDFRLAEVSSESLFAALGKGIAPLLAPLGFGNWRAAVSLLSGLIAKEGIVSSFCVLYEAPGYDLSEVIRTAFTPLSAASYLVFSMLYMPCISAVLTIFRESGWKSAAKTVCFQTVIAYIFAFLVYQVGYLIGFR